MRPLSRRPIVHAFANRTDGVAATEFVMVLPVFMLFIFGITSFASTMFIHSNMLNAAREAARRMSVTEASFLANTVHCSQSESLIEGSAEQVACEYLMSWGIDFAVDANDLCPAERQVEVQITADASDAALLDIFGFFNGRTLTADVAMRREAACE